MNVVLHMCWDQLPVFSYGRDGWSSTTYSKGLNGPIVRIPPSRWDDCNAFDKVSTDRTHFRGIKVDAKIYGNFEGFLVGNVMTPV